MLKINIGLEAEMFVIDPKGVVIDLSSTSIPRDNFPLLAEVRGEYASDTPTVIGNFHKEYASVVSKLNRFYPSKKWRICLTDKTTVPESIVKPAIRIAGMSRKEPASSIYVKEPENEFFKNLNSDGKVESRIITAGLHIHFSAYEVEDNNTEFTDYEPILKHAELGQLYRKGQTRETSGRHFSVPLIQSQAVVAAIIKKMDVTLGRKYIDPAYFENCSYRQLGQYRKRGPGHFEYRSLPFNKGVMDDLVQITALAFDIVRETVTGA